MTFILLDPAILLDLAILLQGLGSLSAKKVPFKHYFAWALSQSLEFRATQMIVISLKEC